MKPKHYLILLLLLLNIGFLFNNSIFAQIPEIKWQQCYGTENNDDVYSITPTNQGYMIAICVEDGTGLTNNHGGSEIWVINIDSTGFILWEKCFGGSLGDGPQKIIRMSNNEYFIYGLTRSYDGDVQSNPNGGDNLFYLWLVKIDENGDIIWEKCYGCPGPNKPRDFILTPDGGGLLLSRIGASGGDVSQYYGSWDNWLCKIDHQGEIEWEKTVGNQHSDNAISMQIMSNNNILITGATCLDGGMIDCGHNPEFGYDILNIEIDMTGEIVSQDCYGGTFDDIGYIVEELDNGLIMAGVTNSNDGDVSGYHGVPGAPGYYDIWAVRLNSDREIVWQRSLGGYGFEVPSTISQTEDGNFLLIGSTCSHACDVSGNHSMGDYSDHIADVWVVKLSSVGDILWQKCYGGKGDESLFSNMFSTHKKSDYNYVLAYQTDYVSDDIMCEIHQTNRDDAWIFEIGLEDTTSINEYDESNSMIKIYPNPTQDYVVFEHSLSEIRNSKKHKASNGFVIITNIFGKQIAKLPLTKEKSVWDTREIPSGVYLYMINLDENQISGKLVIQH